MPLRQALSNVVSDLGTAFNLPEFNISEFLAPKVQASDGGTTSSTSDPNQTIAPTQSTTSFSLSGQPEPTSTTSTTQSTAPSDSRLQQLEKTNRNPVQEDEYQQLLAAIQAGGQSDQAAIEGVFNPLIQSLNQAESTVRADFPSVLSEAQSAFDLNKQTLDTSKEQGLQQLGESDINAERRRQTGTDNSRRLFNELSRGGIQRFGGSTSAGQGFQDLLGVEQQRSSSQRFQEFSTAKREIETQKFNLNQEYSNTLLQIQNSHESAKNQARREFDAKIAQINGQKATAESQKAAAKLGALQDMRNQVNQINFSLAESRQLLDQQAQKAVSTLSATDQALDEFIGAGQESASNIGTEASSGLSLPGSSSARADSFAPTGQVGQSRGDRREELFGLNPLIFGN